MWERFREKIARHRVRLETMDYNVGSGSFKPWTAYEKQKDGSIKVTLNWEVEGTHSYYHLGDGKFRPYKEPFTAEKGSTLTTVSFFHGVMKEKPYDFKIEI